MHIMEGSRLFLVCDMNIAGETGTFHFLLQLLAAHDSNDFSQYQYTSAICQ
jgi:hypothetical protein